MVAKGRKMVTETVETTMMNKVRTMVIQRSNIHKIVAKEKRMVTAVAETKMMAKVRTMIIAIVKPKMMARVKKAATVLVK